MPGQCTCGKRSWEMFISQNTTSSTYHQPQYNILNIVCTNPQHSYSVSARLFVSGCQVSVPVKKGVGRPLSARIQLPQFIISHSTTSSTLFERILDTATLSPHSCLWVDAKSACLSKKELGDVYPQKYNFLNLSSATVQHPQHCRYHKRKVTSKWILPDLGQMFPCKWLKS